jgi:hypothetical protein
MKKKSFVKIGDVEVSSDELSVKQVAEIAKELSGKADKEIICIDSNEKEDAASEIEGMFDNFIIGHEARSVVKLAKQKGFNNYRVIDLDFKHTEVSAPGNTLNGKLVVFSLSEKGYRWGLTTEGNDAGRHGEDVQLSMDVPYNQLTKVANIGRSQYDVELSARVLAGIRNHHCNVENGIATSGRFSAGTLDFPDARYRVMCTIMSSETDNLGEPIPVGTTNAQRYTAHSGPQGYDIDDVQVGLCARVLKGTNTFELNFYRIKSMEKV